MLVVSSESQSGPARRAGPTDAQRERPADEARLGARFAAGERDAAEEVVERYAPRVARLVQRLLAWSDDVDDVVQDVFVRALDGQNKFRGESRLETWLVRIAINACRQHNRRRWVRQRFLVQARAQASVAGAETPGHEPGPAETDGRGPAASAQAREQAAIVRAAVAKLATKYREVVVLYYLEQMTAAEVATLLMLRVNTVEVRLSRARKQLASVLEQFETT